MLGLRSRIPGRKDKVVDMADFLMKIHENYIGQKVVAVSDPEILDTHIEDAFKGIDFFVSKSFYGEEEIEAEEVLNVLRSADNVNMIGNNIVGLAVKEKVISKTVRF